MKKIMLYTLAMMFVLALGSAYAGNGITDFSGKSYDNMEIVPAPVFHGAVEGSSAGGLRAVEPAKELYNGVTDFTGKHYDNQEIVPAAAAKSVEGESAGGLRKGPESKKASLDFGTGRNYDTIPMNPALGW